MLRKLAIQASAVFFTTGLALSTHAQDAAPGYLITQQMDLRDSPNS